MTIREAIQLDLDIALSATVDKYNHKLETEDGDRLTDEEYMKLLSMLYEYRFAKQPCPTQADGLKKLLEEIAA